MRAGDLVAGRFEVEALAGSGGVGHVYRARDRHFGGRVALKVLRPCAARDIQRFAREVRVLSRLSDPAIVRYVAHGTTEDGEPYLAMEWLDGEDLAGRLTRAPLSVAESVALVRRAAEALAAAHANGVVHRDIKPGNLFLCRGRLDGLKLLDFGLAWCEGAGVDLTRTGLVVGTLGYMAPEQAQGDRHIDPRTDVFSLGCVVHRCIARRAPFDSDRIGAMLLKILHEEAPRLSTLAPGVPPALDDLVARMLSKDPAQRPAHGGEVARALGDLLAEIPVESARGSRLQVDSSADGAPACFVAIATQRDWLSPAAPDLFVVFEVSPDLAERVRAVAARHCGRLETLADGSLLVMFTGGASVSELAARGARCALALRALLPLTPIAATVGFWRPSSPSNGNAAVDTASGLLGATAVKGGPEGDSRRVRLDARLAGLLDSGFEVETDELGPALVGERVPACAWPQQAGRASRV